jgi:hypothetical protein
MLATIALLRCCYGTAAALPLLLPRGHIGVCPLECVFPAVDDLPRPDEDPSTGRGLAELLDVMVRDIAPARSECRMKNEECRMGSRASYGFLAGRTSTTRPEGLVLVR